MSDNIDILYLHNFLGVKIKNIENELRNLQRRLRAGNNVTKKKRRVKRSKTRRKK